MTSRRLIFAAVAVTAGALAIATPAVTQAPVPTARECNEALFAVVDHNEGRLSLSRTALIVRDGIVRSCWSLYTAPPFDMRSLGDEDITIVGHERAAG